MNNCSDIIVYSLRNLDRYLIQRLFPNARLLNFDISMSNQLILKSLSDKRSRFVFHIDLSLTKLFPLRRRELVSLLREAGHETWNADLTDISKREIQRHSLDRGYSSTAVDQTDAPETPVIVKTNLNFYGEPERQLSSELQELACPEEHYFPYSHSFEYQVMTLSEVPDDWWGDTRLIISRYISSQVNELYRLHLCGDRIGLLKGPIRAKDRRLWPPDSIITYAGIRKKTMSKLNTPIWRSEASVSMKDINHEIDQKVLDTGLSFASSFNIDYGALDILRDDHGSVYIIDVNPTPSWGFDKDSQFLRFLRGDLK